jgi:hypothetical protein
MTILASDDLFVGNINNALRQVTIVANGGSAVLEAKAGTINDPNTVGWAPVPDGSHSADINFTMYAPANQVYRFKIAGAARVWVT